MRLGCFTAKVRHGCLVACRVFTPTTISGRPPSRSQSSVNRTTRLLRACSSPEATAGLDYIFSSALDMAEASLSPHHNTDVISSTTFNQTWSPSAVNSFDISTLPVPKAHKAWERRPQAPHNQAAKYKKVWRTYGLRSTNDSRDNGSEAEAENDRARAIKRMCINDGAAPILPVAKIKTRKNYTGTKFDRRKSGITRE